MSDINTLFLTATRSKFRFPSGAGQLTAEDLWDLPLTGKGANLDDIARGLHKSLKEADGEISFVKPSLKTTADIQAKLDIVKYVIDQKMSERDARAAAEDRASAKKKIMEKLEEKKNAALSDMSVEQLEALLNQL